MIIPQFKLCQDEKSLTVLIRLPYLKVSACEFYIEEFNFKFYLKPYLLNLHFDQPLRQTEEPIKTVYSSEKYILSVSLEKANPGEHFQGLNMLQNILVNKKHHGRKDIHKIEVISSETKEQGEESCDTPLKINPFNYGFNMSYEKVFDNLQEECLQLFAFDPKDASEEERLELSEAIRGQEMDKDSYFFDKYENEEILYILESQEAISYLEKNLLNGHSVLEYSLFKKSINRQIILEGIDDKMVVNQIISIVFSILYELICMDGDFGPESAKTINKTSNVLYGNVTYRFLSLREVLVDCAKRCVTYSLYKHVQIISRCIQLMKSELSVRLMGVALGEIRNLFEKSEPRYLLNKIYIDQFVIYLQQRQAALVKVIPQFLKELKDIKIDEKMLEIQEETPVEKMNLLSLD